MLKLSIASKADHTQLVESIDKLMHYLLPYTKRDIVVQVLSGQEVIYESTFVSPLLVNISPTLYTRIDGCHGAGNCCRVPFDLVYTGFDRERIIQYDSEDCRRRFGAESALTFEKNREDLLANLVPLGVVIRDHATREKISETYIYARTNHVINPMSGRKSCPYLVMAQDRYLCGIHPFKPLHCWYPHMTVRVTEPRDGGRPSISIGRMQYGRNHKFGCPVIFTEVQSHDDGALFAELQVGAKPNYFDSQFYDDVDKLKWTSDSARSMGFSDDNNVAVGLHERLRESEMAIRSLLANGNPQQLNIWRNPRWD